MQTGLIPNILALIKYLRLLNIDSLLDSDSFTDIYAY